MSDGPLRILLVADYENDPRLGSAKVVLELRQAFEAAGPHCDLLLGDSIGAHPSGRQLRQLVAPALAARAVGRTRQRYDVIDAASAEGLWIAAARRLGRRRSTAIVCRSNGLEQLNYRRMLDDSRDGLVRKPWTRRVWYPASRLSQVAAAARLADRLIVLNAGDKRYAVARRWKAGDHVDVVPHGVSARFLAGTPDGGERRGVLFCGTWDHVKGVAYLTRAFDLLAASGRRVPLTVLGPGVSRDVVLSAFPDTARPLVTVVDRQPEDEVMAAYRRHAMLVFPSTYEGFGLVALEAMSQGLAVIATPVGCIPDLLRDGETGILVPPRDPAAIAGAVGRLLDAPHEVRRLGCAAAEAVAGMTWARTAGRTLDVYRQALSQIQ